MLEKPCFPEPLGEVVNSIVAAAGTLSDEYQKAVGVDTFVSRLLEIKDNLQSDLLGRLYSRWHDSPRGVVPWSAVVREYQTAKNKSSNGVVQFGNYPTAKYLHLPTLPAYKGNGVYDIEEVRINADLQAGFARALGVLGGGKTWKDFINCSSTRLVSSGMWWKPYQEAVATYRVDPEILLYTNDDDTLEFPVVIPQKHRGVAAYIRFASTAEKGERLSIEELELLPEKGAFITIAAILSTDLFLAGTVSRLQTPEGKDRFLSNLSQLFLIR